MADITGPYPMTGNTWTLYTGDHPDGIYAGGTTDIMMGAIFNYAEMYWIKLEEVEHPERFLVRNFFAANPSPTPSPTPSISITPTISITPSISISATPSETPSMSVTPSISISATPSISVTPSITPSTSRIIYNIGDVAFGGKVAYVNGTTSILIAAESNISNQYWGCRETSITTPNDSLGGGSGNTINISNECTSACAAYDCYNLSLSGYTDWYLPCITELGYLYTNRTALGIPESNLYWTSNNYDDNNAYYQAFSNGATGNTDKNAENRVRPVRLQIL
jgi:hypothetical protein